MRMPINALAKVAKPVFDTAQALSVQLISEPALHTHRVLLALKIQPADGRPTLRRVWKAMLPDRAVVQHNVQVLQTHPGTLVRRQCVLLVCPAVGNILTA